MVCRNCHATIADKAIVCYRCGTPTAAPVAPAPVRRGGSAGIIWAIVLIAAAAFLWWQLPGPVTAPSRVAAAVLALCAVVIAVLRQRRRGARR
jgi:hypothetical protein